MRLINIGFGNMVMESRIIAIVATLGRKTKTLIITDSNHVIMSAINPETISLRIEKGEKNE